MKKYIVIGGRVESKYDSDMYYIPPNQLIHLYGVDPQECYTCRNQEEYERYRPTMPDLPLLRPRYDGDYEQLPTRF